MQKKPSQSAPKPLPSALTVASPAAQPSDGTTLVAPRQGRRPPRRKVRAAKAQQAAEAATAAQSDWVAGRTEEAATVPQISSNQLVKVRFTCLQPAAQKVALCGTFNAWSTEATPMSRAADGNWHATVPLPPGRYEYKFLIDGQWTADLHAPEAVMNEFGTFNSVRHVEAGS